MVTNRVDSGSSVLDSPKLCILHVACIEANPFRGVSVVVPRHVLAQGKYAETALFNFNADYENEHIRVFLHSEYKSLSELPKPFNKPDLIVFHEVYHPEFLGFAKRASKAGVPYVVVPHGCLTSESQSTKRLKKVAGNALLFNSFVNRALALQLLSDREFRETNRLNKKFVSSNGTCFPNCHKESFRKNGIKLVYIGRLPAFIKGLDMMMEGVALSRKALIEAGASVDLYGPATKDWFEQVEYLISVNGVTDLVTLHHEIVGADKETTLLDSDIFIQTSRSEGMPAGVLEALAYGLPCILTEGTTLSGLAHEHRFGWSAGSDPLAISQAIEKALSEKEQYCEMSRNARRYIESNYTWDEVSKNAIDTYCDFLS